MENSTLLEAKKLLDSGKSVKEAARTLNSDYRILLDNLSKEGLYVPTRKTAVVLTPELEKEIIDQFKEGKNFSEIGKNLNLAFSTVNHYLIRVGLHVPGSKGRIKKRKAEIEALYKQGFSSRQIAKKLGCAKSTVLRALDEDIKREPSSFRMYELNQEYFDVIDTSEKAYFLGLMFTDGSVSSSDHNVSIALTDLDCIEAFKKALETDKPIYVNERSKENPKWKDVYTLSLNSEKLKNSLITWGCVPNKVRKLNSLPVLDKNLYSHFFRGVFDGDGSVYIPKNRSVTASINGYEPFLKVVREKLLKQVPVLGLPTIYFRKGRSGDIRYSTKEKAKAFYDYLYKDATVYMSRKKNIFDEYFASSDRSKQSFK